MWQSTKGSENFAASFFRVHYYNQNGGAEEYLSSYQERSSFVRLRKNILDFTYLLSKKLKVQMFLCLTKHHAMHMYGGVEA
jgi:hypothetical protein